MPENDKTLLWNLSVCTFLQSYLLSLDISYSPGNMQSTLLYIMSFNLRDTPYRNYCCLLLMGKTNRTKLWASHKGINTSISWQNQVWTSLQTLAALPEHASAKKQNQTYGILCEIKSSSGDWICDLHFWHAYWLNSTQLNYQLLKELPSVWGRVRYLLMFSRYLAYRQLGISYNTACCYLQWQQSLHQNLNYLLSGPLQEKSLLIYVLTN